MLVCNQVETDEAVKWVTDVFGILATGSNWKYYAEVLREHSAARKAIASTHKLLEAASTPSRRRELPSLLSEIQAELSQPALEDEMFADQVEAFVERLEQQELREAFHFGLPELDTHLGGGGAPRRNGCCWGGNWGRQVSITFNGIPRSSAGR